MITKIKMSAMLAALIVTATYGFSTAPASAADSCGYFAFAGAFSSFRAANRQADRVGGAAWDLDSSDSCRCLADRFFVALNWESTTSYREPLALTKLPAPPTSPKHYDLASCLSQFSREETLSKTDSWRCPRCKKSVEATSSIGLWSTPDVLVVHLKRFLCTARW